MTTNFQNGITSSQLTPQAYRNSSQNVTFQETYRATDVQPNSTNRALYTNIPDGLVVNDGSNKQVLGMASTVRSSPANTAQKPSGGYVGVAFIILVVSASLAVFFYSRFKSAPVVVDEQQSEDEE